MPELLKEVDQLETLGDLRAALADLPDDMPISDGMGNPLLISVFESATATEGGTYPPLKYIEVQ